jgi:hypothetical protein
MTDDEDDMETSRIDAVQPWLAPVATKKDLPRKPADGALCFVHGTETVWQYRDGKWIELGRPQGQTRDNG